MPDQQRTSILPGTMTPTESARFDSFIYGLTLDQIVREVARQEQYTGTAWDATHQEWASALMKVAVPQLVPQTDDEFYQAMVMAAAVAFRALRAYHLDRHTFDNLVMDEHNGTD